jgi:hypothetical protein
MDLLLAADLVNGNGLNQKRIRKIRHVGIIEGNMTILANTAAADISRIKSSRSGEARVQKSLEAIQRRVFIFSRKDSRCPKAPFRIF